MNDIRAITATVTGRVQGVGFRFTTQRVATQLGLDGWVRNQPDGSVQTWAQGPSTLMERFIGFLEEGPPASRVLAVDVNDVTPDPDLDGFRVR